MLPGCSIERSSTVAEPGVCVKTTLALAQSSSADPTAVNSHPSSARISSQKDCAISASAPYAKPVKPGRTAAVARAIDFAIAPVPMKPTVWAGHAESVRRGSHQGARAEAEAAPCRSAW